MSTRPKHKPAPGASQSDIDVTSPVDSTAPPLPHERDEGVGMTGDVPSERMQQGHRDLKRGLQDTSRAPEADRAYRKLRR
jgi:hypothetical protein